MSTGTIVMVEPNPGILIVARNVLTRAGHDVVAVAKAEDCVEVTRSRQVDVVLLDARLADPPILSALHANGRIPIILTFQRGKRVAGQPDVDETQPGVATADFLEKPFSPERLLRTVERVLGGWGEPTPPIRRTDTLISVDATQPIYDDDFDADRTDIFPFAHLLEHGRERPPSVSGGAPQDSRKGQLSEHLRTFLEVEGFEPEPRLLSACVRACDAALESATEHQGVVLDEGAAPAIEGVVPELSIDQVLQLAMAVKQPARCRIAHGRAAIDIFYDDGNVSFARAGGLPDGFLLGQLLVADEAIDEMTLLGVLNQPADGTRLGQRLVASGRISPSQLASALKQQTEELVYEVVRWSTARFMIFAHDPPPPEARLAQHMLAVPHLLLEGMRRLDEWRRMLPEVGDLESVLDRRDPPSKSVLRDLSSEDRAILKCVDGRKTVAELVRSASRPTYQVYRSLHSLAGRRLVTVAQR